MAKPVNLPYRGGRIVEAAAISAWQLLFWKTRREREISKDGEIVYVKKTCNLSLVAWTYQREVQ